MDIIMSAEEQNEKLSSLVAKLREVFPFPEEKDYDKGYDPNKADGWHLAEIVGSPIMCLEAMIRVCEGNTDNASTEPSINYDGLLADAVCRHCKSDDVKLYFKTGEYVCLDCNTTWQTDS